MDDDFVPETTKPGNATPSTARLPTDQLLHRHVRSPSTAPYLKRRFQHERSNRRTGPRRSALPLRKALETGSAPAECRTARQLAEPKKNHRIRKGWSGGKNRPTNQEEHGGDDKSTPPVMENPFSFRRKKSGFQTFRKRKPHPSPLRAFALRRLTPLRSGYAFVNAQARASLQAGSFRRAKRPPSLAARSLRSLRRPPAFGSRRWFLLPTKP